MVDSRLQMVMHCGRVSVQDDSKHPNKMRVRGILLPLDEPSTKPPQGSNGHRIMVPSSIAKKRLDTIIGMGLNYAAGLDTHAQRRKVGVIQKAWIDGGNFWIEATVWKHDFPESEKDLKQTGLGMSMEIGDVQVQDPHANVWTISDFVFLGATILWKRSAAYYKTQAIAAKADERSQLMQKTKKKPVARQTNISKITEIAAGAAAEAVAKQLMPTIKRQTQLIASQQKRLDAMELAALGVSDEELEELNAETEETTEVDACDDVKAKSKKADMDDDDDMEEDDDDMDAETDDINKGDLEQLGEAPDDDEDDPGHMSEDVSNKGSKTTSSTKTGKTVSSSALLQLAKMNKTLLKEVKSLRQQVSAMGKKQTKIDKQVTAAGEDTKRKSATVFSADVTGLLAKGGLNASEMSASGQKLSVQDVDVLLSTLNLPTEARMQAKNKLLQAGLMEQGEVNRAFAH